MKRTLMLGATLSGLILAVTACGSSGSSGGNTPAPSGSSASSSNGCPPAGAGAGSSTAGSGSVSAPASGAASFPAGTGSITVGSADFPENTLLADIYGDAMAAKGVKVSK